MSFSFGFLVAACRIRSVACDMRTRPRVRCMLWLRGFPLVPVLPSIGFAGTDVPLFAALDGTMTESDCFNPYIIVLDYLLSSAAPVRLPGRIESLSGPLRGRAGLGSQTPRSPDALTITVGRCCLRPLIKPRHSGLGVSTLKYPCPPAPLPTLHMAPRDALHTARGGSGSLHLSSRRTFTGYPRQS